MGLLKCVICCKNQKKYLFKNFGEKCHPVLPTILDMLKFCIPQLITSCTVSLDDNICRKCLNTLKTCVGFIEQCLVVCNKEAVEDVKPEIEICDEYLDSAVLDAKDELRDDCDLDDDNQNKFDGTHDVWGEDNMEIAVQCDLCKEDFASKDILIKHISKKHGNLRKQKMKKVHSVNCEKCQEKCKNQKLLKEHMKAVHSQTFVCLKCGKNFKTKKRLIHHEELYKDKVSCKLKCEKCHREYKYKTDYIKHIEKVKDAPTCDYETCPVCSQKFSKADYEQHLSVHPRKVCEVCGEGFSNLGAFLRHKISHNEPNQAICPVCGKGFTHSQKLNTHLRITHDYGERNFSCTRCPKKFFNNHKLELHLKRHDNIKDIPCPQCDKMFLSKTLFQTHFKAVHLNFRPHTCPECNRKFARPQQLQKHLETHMKSKARAGSVDGIHNIIVDNPGLPSKCHHCGRVFKNLNQLKQHIKTVHVRIRRFKCEFCEMRFICKHTQLKHQEKHKDPCYEFRCKICYKKNKSQEELDDHLKKHTKLPFQCKICNKEFGRAYLLENHMLSEHPNADLHVPQKIMDEALQNVVFIENQKE